MSTYRYHPASMVFNDMEGALSVIQSFQSCIDKVPEFDNLYDKMWKKVLSSIIESYDGDINVRASFILENININTNIFNIIKNIFKDIVIMVLNREGIVPNDESDSYQEIEINDSEIQEYIESIKIYRVNQWIIEEINKNETYLPYIVDCSTEIEEKYSDIFTYNDYFIKDLKYRMITFIIEILKICKGRKNYVLNK